MQSMYAKLYQRTKRSKYRKLLSTEECIYSPFHDIVTSSSPYTAGATLEDGEWFYVPKASKQEYAHDLMNSTFQTVDYDTLLRTEFINIDFIFTIVEKDLYIQNVSKSKLVSKRHIMSFGEDFKFQSSCSDLVINDLPDAIYHRDTDTLYFRKLESITGIFKGIDQLYREATEEETEQFLKSDFITLKDGYYAGSVKTANRKRIALAKKTLEGLSEADKRNIFMYIADYCPNLKTSECTFEVGSEDELKMLTYGIEQRFYTTIVGNEKRIANSVITFA